MDSDISIICGKVDDELYMNNMDDYTEEPSLTLSGVGVTDSAFYTVILSNPDDILGDIGPIVH